MKKINQLRELIRNKLCKNECKKKISKKGAKIVVVGGGTGLSVLLRGLKKYTQNITAIVTVADDGGGSGILREDLGMLPPGDIRSCLLALSNTEPTMEKMLQYRFKEGNLKGQSFGNLFIAVMNEIYGSFEMAVKEASSVLNITGKVLPMTLQDVKLYAILENGSIVQGESNLPQKSIEYNSRIKKVFIKPKRVKALRETIEAIEEADCIVLGPGSLYTSVMPNLLVDETSRAIEKSSAVKIYISNVMTQHGETDGYGVIDHVRAIKNNVGRDIIDYVIANTEDVPEHVLKRYYKDMSKPVVITENEEEKLLKDNIIVIKENLLEIKKDYIRHDYEKLSKIILQLIKDRS